MSGGRWWGQFARSFVLGIAMALAYVGFASLHSGCKSDNRDYFVVQYEAGTGDADAGAAVDEAGVEIDPTLGGPCTEDSQCVDVITLADGGVLPITCTFDRCDKALSRCRNIPDDTQCSDGIFCNGQEKCRLRQGCVPGPVVSCQDNNLCTIDRCVEATKTCEHLPRDSDGDGDPDDHCAIKKDCDDTDPAVNSHHSEVCGNFKDDNCDGNIDEQPCSTAANDDCAAAFPVTALVNVESAGLPTEHRWGTFLLTSLAAKKDYATSCSVANPPAAQDIVVAITVPPGGGAQDVLVTAQASIPLGVSSNEVAVTLETTCGQAASEVNCGHTPRFADARAIARGVSAGGTVYAIITTQMEAPINVRVDMTKNPTGSSAKPANESCAAPQAVPVEAPFTVSLIDPSKDLPSDCTSTATTGELTYSFTLSEAHDVRIFASTVGGSGDPVVTLRDSADCQTELRCRVGSTPPVFARTLQPGTHVFSVAGTSQIDANIVVKLFPPTLPPLNQYCSTAPLLPYNTLVSVPLAAQEDAIKNGCLGGGLAAAYRIDLTEPSDVLIVGRFPLYLSGVLVPYENGAVSFNGTTFDTSCTSADRLDCSLGGSPQRVSVRNVKPGSYRAVIADEKGLNAELMALVRPTAVPVTVTSDGCINPTDIPETGGFFTGDTTGATADFGTGCDAANQPIGGAPDQLMRLVLTQKRRMIFDMVGSTYTTILDIRNGSGGSCPGVEMPSPFPGTCYVGFTGKGSFLDLVLDPGTYFVQIDGYSGSFGHWNLDVRALPP